MTIRVCNDYGDPNVPDCLRTPDDRYTMDFTDVEPGAYLYWCAHCGPLAKKMEAALDEALHEGPERVAEISAAIDAEVAKMKERSS